MKFVPLFKSLAAVGAAILTTAAVTSTAQATAHSPRVGHGYNSIPSSSSAAESSCGHSIDPYSLSTSAVQACGDSIFPATSTTALPDGGTSTIYTVDGSTVEINTPPPGFNPLSATSQQLSLYNIPTVGEGMTEADFQSMASNFHPVAAPPALIAVPNLMARMSLSAS